LQIADAVNSEIQPPQAGQIEPTPPWNAKAASLRSIGRFSEICSLKFLKI
jgi:hypothetical protein